jgi:hypothetical protein
MVPGKTLMKSITHSWRLRHFGTALIVVLAAGLWTALPMRGQEPIGTGDSDLPSAQSVIQKFVAAIGGKEEFLKLSSQHLKGAYSMPAQGISGGLEVLAAKPNKLLITIEMGDLGKVSSGFNGEVAWMVSPATGPMLLEGAQMEQIKEQADFYSILHDPKDFKSMETVRKTNYAGKEAYELRLVRKDGREVTEYYDVESGLELGFSQKQDSPLGSMVVTNTVGEYKQFGTVRLPTRIAQVMGPIEQVMTVTSVEFNTVDDSVFKTPPEIKALGGK